MKSSSARRLPVAFRRAGLLAVILAMSLAACGSDEPADTEASDDEATATEEPADSEDEEADDSDSEEPEAAGEVVTLRWLSAFDPTDRASLFSFEFLEERLPELTDGTLQIELTAGPESVDPFSFGEVIGTPAADIGQSSSAYTWSVIPEAAAYFYSCVEPPSEEREQGALDYLDQIHREKINATVLGRAAFGQRYAFYSQIEVNEWNDLEGEAMRVSPAYIPIIENFGGQPISMPAGELFTALERGTVSGFAWPDVGATRLGGAHELINYRILPSYLQSDIMLYVNADVWEGLSPEHQEALTTATAEMEEAGPAFYDELREEEAVIYEEAGVETIEPSDGDMVHEWAYAGGREFLRTNVSDPDVAEELISRFIPEGQC